MKSHKAEPAPLYAVPVANEFLEQLYWTLNRVLDRDGISMLQWAFMQRALDDRDGIPFRRIIEVTGESKDNVRRAAAKLTDFAEVIVDPKDGRARKLVLTKRGRKRARIIMGRFEIELFKLLRARDERSERVRKFKRLLWDANAYLAPSDLASDETTARSQENRRLFPDTSLNYTEEDPKESVWLREETPDDRFPW